MAGSQEEIITNPYKIYGLASPQDEIIRYIGYTKQTFERRLTGHLCEKTNCRKTNWIKSLINKNQRPIVILIEDEISKEEVCNKEINYIKLFKSFGAKLVNGTGGGDGNVNITDETRKKISLGNKGKSAWNKGKPYPMKEETKKKIGLANTGKPKNKGIVRSEEFKNKLRNIKRSEEFKAKYSIPVLQFDLDGNFIKEWKSQIEAMKTLKVNCLKACCTGEGKRKRKTSGGFIWRYKYKV